jgi:hypothetical protein
MKKDQTRNDRAKRYRRRRVEAGLVEIRNVWVLAEERREAMRRLRPLEQRAAKKLEEQEDDD